MVQTHPTTAEPTSVTTTLNYFQPPLDGSRPFQTTYPDPNSPTGQRLKNYGSEPHIVQIENLRGKESSMTLDRNGFMFLSGTQPAHTAFVDDEEIRREYYPESIELLKKVTGASRVVLFDHTIRRSNPEITEDTPDKRKPVSQVHVDQTVSSATARVHRHLPPSSVPHLLAHRFQIINLWRPISHPALEFPLALCDFQSVDPKRDLVPTLMKYPDRDGETNNVRFSAGHRWKYVRGMRTDEAVLIKCYDSTSDPEVAVFTPHSAFADPTTPADAPLRQSIELRALVFYEDQ